MIVGSVHEWCPSKDCAYHRVLTLSPKQIGKRYEIANVTLSASTVRQWHFSRVVCLRECEPHAFFLFSLHYPFSFCVTVVWRRIVVHCTKECDRARYNPVDVIGPHVSEKEVFFGTYV